MVGWLHRRSLLLGLIVPLALLAGQLSAVVHSMVVQHQRCPEHGELVHRVQTPGRAESLPPSDARHHSMAVVAAQAVADPHDDDHCLSLVGRRETTGPSARASADLGFPPRNALTVAAADASRERGAQLLRLAPKTSPPADA
jgi:hypothetical protein